MSKDTKFQYLRNVKINIMKKFSAIKCTTLFMLSLVLFSCSTEYDDGILASNENGQFTISQAKEYYETTFPKTKSHNLVNEFLCTDFTPLWESAKHSITGNIESIDVPIDKKVNFIMRKGRDFVLTPQRLTIIKDNSTEIASSFLTTFIPDAKFLKTYNISNYDPKSFETSGNKGNYSGLVIYTPTTNSKIVLINVYKNGKKIDSANVLSTDISENKANIARMAKFLKGIHVYPSTKSRELASINQ